MKNFSILLLFLFIFCCNGKGKIEDITFNEDFIDVIISDGFIEKDDFKEKEVGKQEVSFYGKTPDLPGSVYFSLSHYDENSVFIDIIVNEISDVYGIALNVKYSGDVIKFNEAKFINIYGNPVSSNSIYLAKEKKEGEILFVMTYKGLKAGKSIGKKQKIAELIFKITKKGESEIKFFTPKCAFINHNLERIKNINFYHGKISVEK